MTSKNTVAVLIAAIERTNRAMNSRKTDLVDKVDHCEKLIEAARDARIRIVTIASYLEPEITLGLTRRW